MTDIILTETILKLKARNLLKWDSRTPTQNNNFLVEEVSDC